MQQLTILLAVITMQASIPHAFAQEMRKVVDRSATTAPPSVVGRRSVEIPDSVRRGRVAQSTISP